MILFLDGHDLRQLTIGLIEQGVFSVLETTAAAPEQYLAHLDLFLKKYDVKLETLESISIVSGPGAFTSSRISLTIANTLHFVLGLPLFVLENQSRLSPQELLGLFGVGTPVTQGVYAGPFYATPPHITSPASGDKPLAD